VDGYGTNPPQISLQHTLCAGPFEDYTVFYQVMAPEDVETVLDYMAYCLWRGFPFHRWILFNGSGRNGKGVTTNLITRFLGQNNVSSETLHRLLDRTFAAAKLFGKMANIDADLSSDVLKETGLLKKLTGGDRIPAEDKFKPLFDFNNYAKLIFSANKIPKTPDESDAFYARLIIINFSNHGTLGTVTRLVKSCAASMILINSFFDVSLIYQSIHRILMLLEYFLFLPGSRITLFHF
jgi:hypothetical protein